MLPINEITHISCNEAETIAFDPGTFTCNCIAHQEYPGSRGLDER